MSICVGGTVTTNASVQISSSYTQISSLFSRLSAPSRCFLEVASRYFVPLLID